MRTNLLFAILFTMVVISAFAQTFTIPDYKSYEDIDFKPEGNLVYVPVEINHVPLNFVLDTGVNKTVILGLSQDTLELNHVEEIFLTGLGKKEPFKAIYSSHNILKIGDMVNADQDVFIVLDEEVNFSKRLGLEVHGIIGYDLLKDFVVQIDYIKGKVRFYRYEDFNKRKKRNEVQLDIFFQRNKPYLKATVNQNKSKEVTLLVDTGSSDALWLFETDTTQIPHKYFEDYLGVGLTGEIRGKRSKINGLSLGEFTLKEVKSAFPDAEFLIHIDEGLNRDGTLGAEVLSRFLVTINYRDKWIRLKKNKDFNQPFNYNMSGIIIQHNGLRLMEDHSSTRVGAGIQNGISSQDYFFRQQLKYKLAPVIEIVELRENSPAALAGLQPGDILLNINHVQITKENIGQLLKLLNVKEGKKIKLVVERNGVEMKFSFILKNLL